MFRLALMFSRVLVLGIAIFVVSSSVESSTISQTPQTTKTFGVYTVGNGSFTKTWTPSVIVQYGNLDSSGQFVPFNAYNSLTASMSVSDVNGTYNFNTLDKQYPGATKTKYYISSILYEIQMGKKELAAANLASVTTN